MIHQQPTAQSPAGLRLGVGRPGILPPWGRSLCGWSQGLWEVRTWTSPKFHARLGATAQGFTGLAFPLFLSENPKLRLQVRFDFTLENVATFNQLSKCSAEGTVVLLKRLPCDLGLDGN